MKRRGFLRRHWFLTLLILLAVALRVALPYVLPGILSDQLSAAIKGTVKIGAMDLSLLRGSIGFDDIGVFAESKPDEAVIALRRLYVDLSWRALPRRQILLDELLIAEPRVEVDRLANDEINLAGLIRETAPESEPEPPAEVEEGAAWAFGVERFVLDGGALQFTDRATAEPVTVPLQVDRLALRRAAYGAGVYDDAATVEIAGKLAGAPLEATGQFKLLGDTLQASVEVNAEGVPIGWLRPYVDLAWSGLDGKIDLQLNYQLEPKTRHGVRGTVTARGVTVLVDEVTALAFTLAVGLDDIDLLAQRAALGSVRLSDAQIVVRPRQPQPLPFLLARGEHVGAAQASAQPTLGAAAEGDTESESPPAAAPAAPAERSALQGEGGADAAAVAAADAAADAPQDTARVVEPAVVADDGVDTAAADSVGEAAAAPAEPAWQWSVQDVSIDNGKVTVEVPEHSLEVGVTLAAQNLSGERQAEFPARLTLVPGAGSLVVDGKTGIDPLSFAGGVKWEQIDIPTLLALAPPPLAGLIAAASTQGDMHVAVAGEIVETKGSLRFDDVRMERGDGREFAVGVAALEVDVQKVRIAPGVPAQIEIGSVELRKPEVLLTRRPDGLVLLDLATAAAVPPEEAAPAAENGAAPGPEVRVGKLRLSDGRVRFLDRALKSHADQDLRKVTLVAESIAWPEATVGNFDFSAKRQDGGELKARGRLASGDSEAEVKIDDWSLPENSPYAEYYSGYGIERGRLTLESKIAISGKTFKADTDVVLHELDVSSGGGSLFQDRFGIPISVALELLRNLDGDIDLDLPLRGDTDAPGVAFLSLIGSTLQKVIANALISPLKLVGAVVDGAGRISGMSGRPVPFAAGSSTLDAEGEKSLGSIVKLLAKRPGLRAVIKGAVVDGDLAPMARAALRAELEEDPQSLPDGDEVLDHLRSDDDVADLDDDTRQAMDARLAELAASDDVRVALAKARAVAVRDALREAHGIESKRVGVIRSRGTLRSGAPRADIELGAKGMKGSLGSLLGG